MTRTATIVMAVALIIGSVSAVPMAAATQPGSSVASAIGQSTFAQADENATADATNVTPGERLSGVVGVGQAEFEGEIELRGYGLEFASAATADAKADVVADRLGRIEQRLDDLEQQRDELEDARENGEITEGEYNARVAELAARTETVKQVADASEARAGSLPAGVLESKGINVTAIQTLRTDAENLTGPEVAAIAKTIAGDDVGRSVSQGPPGEIGVPSPDRAGERDGPGGAGDAAAAIDRADEQLTDAEIRIDDVEARLGENASENATAAIEQAREELERARQALQDARSALEVGNEEQALEHAEAARDHADAAEAHARAALDEIGDADGDADHGDGADGSDAGDGQRDAGR